MSGENILPPTCEFDPLFNPYGQMYQQNQYYPPIYDYSPAVFNLNSYGYGNICNPHSGFNLHTMNPPEPIEFIPPPPPQQTIIYKSVDLFGTGRRNRPPKICVILRGLPGSGKSSLARQIRDLEKTYNIMTRILSIDDYFMSEFDDKAEAMMAKITNFESAMLYASSLEKSLRRSVEDSQFDVLVVDACHAKIASVMNLWALARSSGFEAVVAMLPADVDTCLRRMVTASLVAREKVSEVRKALVEMTEAWEETPPHVPLLDLTWLLGGGDSVDVDMEDIPEAFAGGETSSGSRRCDDSDEDRMCIERCSESQASTLRSVGDANNGRARLDNSGKKRVRWASEVDVLILEPDSGVAEDDGADRSFRTSFQLNTKLSALCSSSRDSDGDRLQAKRRRERHEEKRLFVGGLHSRNLDLEVGDSI